MSLEPARVFPAPAFSPKDIEAFLVALGCYRESAGDWSKIINASTSGHPQLVDARVAALAEAGFPKQGAHSVGVTRQHCGQLGKQDNSDVRRQLHLA